MNALIVLPTYQEAADIAEVLTRIRRVRPADSVLVVDDASPDGTAALARAVGREVGGIEVLDRPAKSGLGSAYRDGFGWGLERGYDVLVEMDADLSHDPADLSRLLAPLGDPAGDAAPDVVVGSRYVPGGSIPDWARHRRWLSRGGNRYARWVLGLGIADATSGFRAYRADVVAAIDLERVRADGYGFQIEMLYRCRQAGAKVVEVPIAFADRRHGTSKMSSRIVVEAFALVTVWGLRDRLLGRRLRRDQV